MQYVSLIIGFEVCFLRTRHRKIRVPLSIANLREMKSFIPRDKAIIQSTLPRKLSKLMNIESVPQTDTGDQVE